MTNPPYVFNIFGYKGSGKDTICEEIRSHVGVLLTHISFARPIKELVYNNLSTILPGRDCIFGTIEQKEKELDLEIPQETREKFEFLKDHQKWTGRLLLQFLGTEAFRGITDSFWVDLAIEDIRRVRTHVGVTDCRFPNEYEAINRRLDGRFKVINILVSRGQCCSDLHESEKHSNNFKYDYKIENTGNFEELSAKVKEILGELKVI